MASAGRADALFDRLSLDVEAAEQPWDDPTFSHGPNSRHSHDEVSVQATNGSVAGGREGETGRSVQTLRVPLGSVPERSRGGRQVDAQFLDPRQPVGSEQTPRQRIETPGELISEANLGVVHFAVLLEYRGLAQVWKGKTDVEGWVCQHFHDRSHRPAEPVLGVKAHHRIFP